MTRRPSICSACLPPDPRMAEARRQWWPPRHQLRSPAGPARAAWRRCWYFLLLGWLCAVVTAGAQTTQIQYLSGLDKDHTVPWEFMCTGGGRSNNVLTTIPVPSCWQTKGFGNYGYGTGYNNTSATVGQYRTTFP